MPGPTLPRSSDLTLAERARDYQRREFSLTDTLRTQFSQYFLSFREQLDAYFAQHFVLPLGSNETQSRWASPQARALGTVPVLTSLFSEGLDQVQSEAETALDEDLSAAYLSGFELGIWELFLDGEDIEGIDDPGREDALAAMLAAGIGGASYRDRLGVWSNLGRSRVAQALTSSVAGGLTLSDTFQLYDGALGTVRNGIVSLGSNELFRAMALGTALAYAFAQRQEVWITSADELVCPICYPLHLVVTDLQPIEDSHSGCRCYKILLSEAGKPRRYMALEKFRAQR